MAGSIHHPWDGTTEEGAIPRPGFKYPFVYVIQRDGQDFAWAIYSQGARTAVMHTGRADSLESAREAVQAA